MTSALKQKEKPSLMPTISPASHPLLVPPFFHQRQQMGDVAWSVDVLSSAPSLRDQRVRVGIVQHLGRVLRNKKEERVVQQASNRLHKKSLVRHKSSF